MRKLSGTIFPQPLGDGSHVLPVAHDDIDLVHASGLAEHALRCGQVHDRQRPPENRGQSLGPQQPAHVEGHDARRACDAQTISDAEAATCRPGLGDEYRSEIVQQLELIDLRVDRPHVVGLDRLARQVDAEELQYLARGVHRRHGAPHEPEGLQHPGSLRYVCRDGLGEARLARPEHDLQRCPASGPLQGGTEIRQHARIDDPEASHQRHAGADPDDRQGETRRRRPVRGQTHAAQEAPHGPLATTTAGQRRNRCTANTPPRHRRRAPHRASVCLCTAISPARH